MESDLKILKGNGFISKKQFRELLSREFSTQEELGRYLTQNGILDAPDWKEAQNLLKADVEEDPQSAPDSSSPSMQAIMDTALKVASTDTTILILGESGVGKSRLARSIHTHSPRRNAPFVTVSCGSIPETLLESELFGVEKGAYTGAVRSREGRFKKADGGTIFLDEIGEITPAIQVKLLRVIQEKKIEPLGSSQEETVDVRLIAATNRNLEQDVKSGRFREDLYFRLNVVPLTMLPLRERREDILPFVGFFLKEYQKRDGQEFVLEDALKDILGRYSWPGNIRELQNCIERMSVLSRNGHLRAADLPPRILEETGYRAESRPIPVLKGPQSQASPAMGDLPASDGSFPSMQRIEEHYIKLALQASSGNIFRAAAMLQIHRNTLSRKLDELGIDPSAFKSRQRKTRRKIS